jgi:hypothetical protein
LKEWTSCREGEEKQRQQFEPKEKWSADTFQANAAFGGHSRVDPEHEARNNLLARPGFEEINSHESRQRNQPDECQRGCE